MKETNEDKIRILGAAKRYHEDTGVAVAEVIGTFELPMIELYLIVEGYLDGEPKLTKPRDN
jgi:hypothetical protein